MERAIEAIDFELAAYVAARHLVDPGKAVLAADPGVQFVERDGFDVLIHRRARLRSMRRRRAAGTGAIAARGDRARQQQAEMLDFRDRREVAGDLPPILGAIVAVIDL